MIILYVLIAFLILAFAATVCMKMFGYNGNKSYRKLLLAVYITCALLIGFCISLSCVYGSNVANLQNEYDNIMLYHDIVSDSTNEAVRFGHYEKVSDFNEKYANMEAQSQSKWFGSLIASDWTENMSLIDFQFRGVNYAEQE